MEDRESSHTPGPWSVDTYGAGQRVVVKGRQGFSGDYRIADAHFSSDLANCVRVAEMQANARLIAAAPELLTALSALIVVADRYDFRHRRSDGGYSSLGDTPAVAAARAAVAKATGAA